MSPPDAGHLYYDGTHYDQRYHDVVEDITFWIEQARKHGDPVLELACGTGRVSIPLAREGFEVTGIDLSDAMLAEARRKSHENGVQVDWVEGDVRAFAMGKQFPLVIFPAQAVAHLLDVQDLERCLSCVRRHLTPTGKFIVVAFNPDLDILRRDPNERHDLVEYPDPDGKGTVSTSETNVYDAAAQINRVKMYYNLPGQQHEVVDELVLRMYFPQELDALLKYNGFVIEDKFGDHSGALFGPSSSRQVIVCSLNN
jgi:ubiquinone/menaquinone biosynthesis C-methylase UbiE